ncbi:MAG: MBL fold metallo-hydrolase [Patescibacteria group bacterium]
MRLPIINHKYILFILILSNLVTWCNIGVIWAGPNSNAITFLDIGQGDATILQTNYSHQIIIDGGPDSTILEKLDHYLPINDKEIELMILTHPHSDHLTGLLYILENYQVNYLVYTNVAYDNQQYLHFQEIIKNKPTQVITATAGQKIIFDQIITLDILYPDSSPAKNLDINDTSIAIKISTPKQTILMMGDLSARIETKLIKQYGNTLNSHILKTGHHGSRSATSPTFLDYVQPEFAIISCGIDNQYHHPHPETIENLANKNITIKRTDTDGDIGFKI